MNELVVGRCSLCGGLVTTPFWSAEPVVPSCRACGAVAKLPDVPMSPRAEPKRRTRADVIAARGSVIGCCNRHADNMACDCLLIAAFDDSHDNGCAICRDPNCSEPNGKH